jgi:hypothetical protein
LPRVEQLEQLIRYSEERGTNRVIGHSIPHLKQEKASLDVAAVLDALPHQEGERPGSVAVRVGRRQGQATARQGRKEKASPRTV